MDQMTPIARDRFLGESDQNDEYSRQNKVAFLCCSFSLEGFKYVQTVLIPLETHSIKPNHPVITTYKLKELSQIRVHLPDKRICRSLISSSRQFYKTELGFIILEDYSTSWRSLRKFITNFSLDY